jgi:hypothetical protein
MHSAPFMRQTSVLPAPDTGYRQWLRPSNDGLLSPYSSGVWSCGASSVTSLNDRASFSTGIDNEMTRATLTDDDQLMRSLMSDEHADHNNYSHVHVQRSGSLQGPRPTYMHSTPFKRQTSALPARDTDYRQWLCPPNDGLLSPQSSGVWSRGASSVTSLNDRASSSTGIDNDMARATLTDDDQLMRSLMGDECADANDTIDYGFYPENRYT